MQMMDLFCVFQDIGFVFFTGCYAQHNTWGIKFSNKEIIKYGSENAYLIACYVENDKKVYDIKFTYNKKVYLEKHKLSFFEFKDELQKSLPIIQKVIISFNTRN